MKKHKDKAIPPDWRGGLQTSAYQKCWPNILYTTSEKWPV